MMMCSLPDCEHATDGPQCKNELLGKLHCGAAGVQDGDPANTPVYGPQGL
jgi:hypothetical protein